MAHLPDPAVLDAFRRWVVSQKVTWQPCSECPLCRSSKFEQLCHKDRFALESGIARCRQCGHLFTSPRPRPENPEEMLTRWLRPVYFSSRTLLQEHQAERARGRIALEFMRAFAEIPERSRWHDVGCGTGGVVGVLRESNFVATGSDIDPAALALGRRRGLDVEQHLQGEGFRVISLMRVLHYFVDPHAALRDIVSRLAPGGYLYVELPGLHAWLRGPGCRGSVERLASPFHSHYFDLYRLQHLLSYHQLRLVAGNERLQALFLHQPGLTPLPARPALGQAFLKSTRRLRPLWWLLSFLPGRFRERVDPCLRGSGRLRGAAVE